MPGLSVRARPDTRHNPTPPARNTHTHIHTRHIGVTKVSTEAGWIAPGAGWDSGEEEEKREQTEWGEEEKKEEPAGDDEAEVSLSLMVIVMVMVMVW
jgi:hypothetical protein